MSFWSRCRRSKSFHFGRWSKQSGWPRSIRTPGFRSFAISNIEWNTLETIVINRTGWLSDEAVLNYSLFTHDQGGKVIFKEKNELLQLFTFLQQLINRKFYFI